MSASDAILRPDDDTPWASLRFERDRLRSEIRTRMDRMLGTYTGIADAHMCWMEKGFLDKIVFEFHCGVESWPPRWPFKNLSDIQGGCKPLQEIRDAIVSGELRIVKLTDEQLAEARTNPESFLPNPTLRSGPAESHRTETYHVIPLVLHPHNLSPISHPQSSEASEASKVSSEPPQPSSSSVASPLIRIAPGPETAPRRQRRDIKKRRHRPVTNPDDCPPRRRRLGVQTPEYVYDPVSALVTGPSEADEKEEDEPCSMLWGSAPSDDYVECFTEPETQSDLEVESEIESATESWAHGSQSEIEEFTSDED